MPRKLKYDYDIEKIEPLENEGVSINEIARRHSWPLSGTHAWIKRHYDRDIDLVVKYTPKSRRINCHKCGVKMPIWMHKLNKIRRVNAIVYYCDQCFGVWLNSEKHN